MSTILVVPLTANPAAGHDLSCCEELVMSSNIMHSTMKEQEGPISMQFQPFQEISQAMLA
jgi:hypothetical protein